MSNYPEGAIQTKEELLAFTHDKEGVLYGVSNGNSWGSPENSFIEELEFTRCSRTEVTSVSEFFRSQTGRWRDSFSLKDRNISARNNYNDHFIFTEQVMAEAYLAAAKKGWHQNSGQRSSIFA